MPAFNHPPRRKADAAKLAAGLASAFGGALLLAGWGGATLVDAFLPALRLTLAWLDDRFVIVVLETGHGAHDTVVHLRTNLIRPMSLGGHVQWPIAAGWFDVTTPVGLMLQPLVVALGLAGAWPGSLAERLSRLASAGLLALGFLLADLPLTLHATVWETFVQALEPGRYSAIIVWRDFMQAGGRLAIGILLAMAAYRAAKPHHSS